MVLRTGRKAPDFDVAAVVKGSQFVDSVKLTKRTWRSIPRSASWLSALLRFPKNSRPLTSITTAILEVLFAAISKRLARSVGGRLSTTYQPKSSRTWATVERPAPLIPVITTTLAFMFGSLSSDFASSQINMRLASRLCLQRLRDNRSDLLP